VISAPWRDRLAEPLSTEHLVQIYEHDQALIAALALYVGHGIGKGEAVVVVATDTHRKALEAKLEDSGYDVEDLEAFGQFRSCDAAELLSRFMTKAGLDPGAFQVTIGEIIAGMRANGRVRKVRVYSETVDLLWKWNHPATRQLEELWNEVIEVHSVSLLCGYRIAASEEVDLPGDLRAIHSHLIPPEAAR
jgi:hypothetical protein